MSTNHDLYLKASELRGRCGIIAAADFATGVFTIATGLSEIKAASVTMNGDPAIGAGDAFHISCTFSGGDLTVKLWQDDATLAAATNEVECSWIAFGT